MRGGRLRHVVSLQKNTEQVPDSGFDDAGAWSFSGVGATVTGSQLRFINAVIISSNTIPEITAVIGDEYKYRFSVSTYPIPIKAEILFGGTKIYDESGAGVFEGQVIPVNTSGLVFLAQLAGQWFIDDISIKKYQDVTTTCAAIEPVNSKSRITRHKYYGDTTHKITLRYSSDIAGIDNSWRVVFIDRIFVIVGIIDINERNQTIVLHCKEGLRESNEPTV